MDPGLVSSLSGALAQSRRVDTIANNLANADTPGFKGDELIFEESLQAAGRQDLRSGLSPGPIKDSEDLSKLGQARRTVLFGSEFTDLHAGGIKQTSNPLDLAIEGNGFFEVLTPKGIRLTRAGNLALDPGGRLVTHEGFLILGAGNKTGDPALRALTVGNAGSVNIDLEGNIYSGTQQGANVLGKISLVQVENPSALTKEGNNLFDAKPEAFVRNSPGSAGPQPASVPGAATQGAPATAVANLNAPINFKTNPLGSTAVAPRIHQGMLETSNVNPVMEMTRLIEAHRLYDENTKLMQAVGDMNSRVADVGKF